MVEKLERLVLSLADYSSLEFKTQVAILDFIIATFPAKSFTSKWLSGLSVPGIFTELLNSEFLATTEDISEWVIVFDGDVISYTIFGNTDSETENALKEYTDRYNKKYNEFLSTYKLNQTNKL